MRSEEEVWSGPAPAPALVQATRRGEMPVAIELDDVSLRRVALAPVTESGRWLGATGVATVVDQVTAGTLAGLTRSEIVILTPDSVVAATTTEAAVTAALADSAHIWRADGQVHEVRPADGRRHLVACAPLGELATVAFLRDMESELAVLPLLRRGAALAGAFALILALALGTLLAALVARPVRSLAGAADQLAAGDFDAPLEGSAVRELDRVAKAFAEMRRALAARLREVEASNRELADRQRRLTALQSELIRRDRLAATGLLVTELAHEIRNPVANVLNCLEVVRRRVGDDPAARQFADMAIDELLRMHELAERMLDLNRPRDARLRRCDVGAVAQEIAGFVRAVSADQPLEISVSGAPETWAAIAPDALKQVLLNVVQNARDAIEDRGRIDLTVRSEDSTVVVEVLDNGPGILPELLPRLFDPFFTTKVRVQGVGLGLFVAEGIVRSNGGRIEVSNREAAPGARFRIELAAVDPNFAHDTEPRSDVQSELST